MNTLQRRSFPVAALGLLVLLAAGPAATSRGQVAAVPVVADQTADQAWSDLATKTYDQRDQLMTGVNRLSARLDDQIRALKAKRAGMTTDVKDWDFDMKDVEECRSLLTSRISDLKQTNTQDTYLAARDKVGEAWIAAEAAVDKMHTTVTS
jgi:hypothetical protein